MTCSILRTESLPYPVWIFTMVLFGLSLFGEYYEILRTCPNELNLNTVTLLNVMHTCNFYNTNLKTVTLHILITYSLMHKCQKQSVIFHIRSTYIKPPFTRKFYSPMLLIPLPSQPMGLMYFNYWFKSFPTKPQIDF